MDEKKYAEGLLERLTQFIYNSARDMNIPDSFMDYYTSLVRHQVESFIDDGETFEPGLLPDWIEIYGRLVKDARQQTKEQLFNELEGHASIAASVFLARAYAVLVEPGLISVFKPREERQ